MQLAAAASHDKNAYKCSTIQMIAIQDITEPDSSLGSTEKCARLNYTYLHIFRKKNE